MKLYNRTDIIEGEPEVGARHHHNRRDHLYNFNDDRSSLSGGSSGGGYGRDLGGHDPGRPSDDMPVLSERDKKELMNLANENISMVFILEMKEAFLLFDKVKAFLVCAKNGHKMTNSKSCFFINRSEFATLKRP